MTDYLALELPVILIVEEDMAKVLGQSLKRLLPRNSQLLSMDKIRCETGDFIDIGEPIAEGKTIPVIVKSLIFND